MKPIDTASKLVQLAGGKVNDRIVSQVGVAVLYDFGLTNDGQRIINYFAELRKDDFDAGKMSDFHRLVDFAARITYLSYHKTSAKELRAKLKAKGHLSVYDMHGIAVLVAGCSLECILELVSNRLNRSCRLTSSKTKAALETLYAKSVDAQWLDKFLALRTEFLKETTANLEIKNQFNLSAKAGYAVISMGLRDWYFVINSRLRDPDLEEEVREVLTTILEQLKKSTNWVF